MKRILFVMNTLGRAGAETALLELLRRLGEEEVYLSLFVLTGQGEMIKEVPEGVRLLNNRYDECPVLTAEGKKHLMKTVAGSMFKRGTIFKLMPYMLRQLADMLRKKRILPDKLLWRVLSDGAERFEERYDLAVAYIEGGSTYYVMDHVDASAKAAFVHVDYNEAGYTRGLDKECYLGYDKIFAVSDEVKSAFLRAYPECDGRTEVFHNLINKDRIISMSKQQGGFTDSYDGYHILTVGRLTAQKDFAQSVYAMKLLKDKGVKAKWYILGEGEQRAWLESVIKKLGLERDFFLPGAVDNPYAYMKQADIYVHATRFEGKSIAIQEAQILGCPVLVSDCSGNREQVNHEEDGLLCDMNPEAIAEGIMELLEDEMKRKGFGEMASRRHLTEDSQIEKLLSLL